MTIMGWVQIALYVGLVLLVARPLGGYLARIVEGERTLLSPVLLPVERGLYRLAGVDPNAGQHWLTYGLAMLLFNGAGLVLLYALQRLQAALPLNPQGLPAVAPDLALNTAVSFVTNTNWQNYAGEATLGYLVQMAGLTTQNFLSAATGIALAIALIRGFARKQGSGVGNFWADLTRITLHLLLPLSVVVALVLVWQGTPQTLGPWVEAVTLESATQTIAAGPVASQVAIKMLGTNGGGFFNANSAHPFENPNGLTNLIEIFLLLLIPVSLTRTFGRLVGDVRQGYAILAAMAALWAGATSLLIGAEVRAAGPALELAGAAMEGKEVRFGVPMSALFASSTTATSTGAVDSMHSSYTAVGGGVAVTNILLGEVAPGGVGSGLYGMLVAAVVAVFIAGLMVGRTPEYLGKKIGAGQMRLVALYILTTPALVLLGLGVAMATEAGRASMLNPGAHGLTEVLYAFASASNNNGSAFAGLNANTDFYNVALAVAMLVGRLLPIGFVLALAGSMARQGHVPATAGTLPTHRPQFVLLLVGVVLIVAGLTFVPALALGPLAEGLS
jgi:K+-transporting ATPase ATPase A chain